MLGQLGPSNFSPASRTGAEACAREKRLNRRPPYPSFLTGEGGLVSLLDMLVQFTGLYMTALEHLTDVKFRIMLSDKFTAKDCDRLHKILDYWASLSETLHSEGTRHLARELDKEIEPEMNAIELNAKIESLLSMIRKELGEHRFLYVPKHLAGYYDNPLLCGADVAAKFRDAIPEIIEAGNCYALGRPTACVFHLMRVIPYGMAALAKSLGVKFSQAIECLEWNSIIQPIDKAVSKLQQLPRSSKKFKDQQYYAEIVQHLYFCKDAWRNHVSHSRERYDMPQARSVMDHVGLIMQLLSKRLKKPFTLR